MCFKLMHTAKLSEYTWYITLHSTVDSGKVRSAAYVIGHRNVKLGWRFSKSWVRFNISGFFFFFFCGILHCLPRRSQNRLPSENRMGKPELSLQRQILCKWSLTFRLAFCTFTLLPFVCLVFWCPFDEKQLKKKNLFYWKPKANSDVDIFCVCSSSWKSLHYVMITYTLCIVFLSLCMNLTHFTSTKFKIICLFHHIQIFSP